MSYLGLGWVMVALGKPKPSKNPTTLARAADLASRIIPGREEGGLMGPEVWPTYRSGGSPAPWGSEAPHIEVTFQN